MKLMVMCDGNFSSKMVITIIEEIALVDFNIYRKL